MDIVLSHTTAFRHWCAFEGDISSLERPRRLFAMAEPLDFTPALVQELASLGIMPWHEEPLHLLFADASLRKRSGRVVSHVLAAKLPAGALVRVSEHVLISSPELAFSQMAEVFEPGREALAGCEMCARYGTAAGGETFSREPLTTSAALTRFAGTFGGERSRAYVAALEALDGAVSPEQAKVALLLCLPTTRGGYGLARPKLCEDGGLSWPEAGFAVPDEEVAASLEDTQVFAELAQRTSKALGRYLRIRSAGFATHHEALRAQLAC